MTARIDPKFNSHFSKSVRGLVVVLFLFLSVAGCHSMKDVRYDFGVSPGVHMGFDAMHRIHPVPQPHVYLEVIPPNRWRHYPPAPRRLPYRNVPIHRQTPPPPTFLQQQSNQ